MKVLIRVARTDFTNSTRSLILKRNKLTFSTINFRPLLGVLLLVLSLFCSLVISPVINATSAYDAYYQKTTSLLLGNNGWSPYYTSCADVDYTTSWRTAVETAFDNASNTIDKASFETSLTSGRYAVSYGSFSSGGHDYKEIYLSWTEDTSLSLDWDSFPNAVMSDSLGGTVHSASFQNKNALTAGSDCTLALNNAGAYQTFISNNGTSPTDSWGVIKNLFVYSDHLNKPLGYAGEDVADGSVDVDEDGLSIAKESAQATSDTNEDTDNDGISDLKESRWFEDRDDVFCDTSTPKNCAYPDPTKKDVYVEIDWMDDGSVAYKPTNTQLETVADMFDNEGVRMHFDTGIYGGGNELANYAGALRQDSVTSIPDFEDYKVGGDSISRNFSANRQGIWRYMISGNQYSNASGISTSSGWAEVLGDDLFIAIGFLNNFSGVVDSDRALAGTIAHELGHGLCLSDSRVYIEQGAGCVFGGIDNNSGYPPTNDPDEYFNLEDYESVMNYRYQATNIDDLGSVEFSHGTNVSNDHDDWSAVKEHVGAFNGSHSAYIEFGARGSEALDNRPVSADGLIVAESRVN